MEISALKSASPSRFKKRFNLLVAVIFTGLACWLFCADIFYPGRVFFSMSGSLIVVLSFYLILLGLAQVFAIIPKRIVLILGLLITFRCAFAYPLSLLVGIDIAAKVASFALLNYAIYYLLVYVRGELMIDRRPWLDLRHSGLIFVGTVAIAILSIPLAVFGILEVKKEFVGDFIPVGFDGISSIERVYEKEGQRVHLIGMMHIGDGDFYDDLMARVQEVPSEEGARRLILTEGVSDRQQLLNERFASGELYREWADWLGVDVQESLENEPSSKRKPALEGSKRIVFLNADIDVSELEPQYRETLIAIVDYMSMSGPLQLLGSPQGVAGYDVELLFTKGLLLRRNDVLMAKFNEHASAYSEIYIPWGAAHLPDVERRLIATGYELVEQVEYPIFAFGR